MTARAHIASLGLALFAGCLSVPGGPTPMCSSSSDCDHAHGEVCQEGTCWGNPPAGTFAAVISAPSARTDLVARELATVDLPADGWMGDLPLDAAVTFGGRLVVACPPPMTSCDPTPLGATITVTRPTKFHGGPGFHTVATVTQGIGSFSIPVPPTLAGDAPYTVTIIPDGRGNPTDTRSSAELVPPLRFTLAAPSDVPAMPIALGGADLTVVSGALSSALGQPLDGYRVVAMGRWDAAAAPQEVSTVMHTAADGLFTVTLSDGLVGPVEIVATPPAGVIAPTLHLANVDSKYSSQRPLVAPPNLGHAVAITLPVLGVDGSGMVSPVAGARVDVSSTASTAQFAFATLDVEATTDSSGKATLNILDGTALAGAYKLSIVPPAGSSLGAVFAQPLTPVANLDPLVLATRISISGKVTDASGAPLGNVAVTVHPSLQFAWSLEAAPQAFVTAIPAATTVTPDNGEFVVWVDANIASTWGAYDIMCEPPITAHAPAWTRADVEIPRDGTQANVPLGTIALPDAAYVHGRIVDPGGIAIEGAELKLYVPSAGGQALCTTLTHAPDSCPIPAQVQGRDTSDDSGVVRLALPRPITP